MPSRRWPELEYVKVKWSDIEELMDAYTETQAAKALWNRCLYFFTGETAKLPRDLQRDFKRFEKRDIDRYRNAVINGAKNRDNQDPSPAETQSVGGTDPQTDPQGVGTSPIVNSSLSPEVNSAEATPQSAEATPHDPDSIPHDPDNGNGVFPKKTPPPFQRLCDMTFDEKVEAVTDFIIETGEGSLGESAFTDFARGGGVEDWVQRWDERGWVDVNGDAMDALVTPKDGGAKVPRWQVMAAAYVSGFNDRAVGMEPEERWNDGRCHRCGGPAKWRIGGDSQIMRCEKCGDYTEWL